MIGGMALPSRVMIEPKQARVVRALEQATASARAGGDAPREPPNWAAVVAGCRAREGAVAFDGRFDRVGLAWWTDHTGRRHVRVALRAGELDEVGRGLGGRWFFPEYRLPLAWVYPDRAWRVIDGERAGLLVACACGAVGTPEAVAWMGDCCGPCFDRRLEGGATPEGSPVTFRSTANRPIVAAADGRSFAIVDVDDTLLILDAATGQVRCVCGRGTPLGFTPDGRRLIGQDEQGGNHTYDTDTGLVVRDAPLFNGRNRAQIVAAAPAGGLLAFAEFGEVQLWDTTQPDLWRHVTTLPTDANRLAFSGDGTRLAVEGSGGIVRVYHDLTGTPRYGPHLPTGGALRGLALSLDGRRLAVAGVPQVYRFEVYDTVSGNREPRRDGHSHSLVGVAFLPGPEGTLLTAAADGMVTAWPADPARPGLTLDHGEILLTMMAFAPNGRTLMTATEDGLVERWPLADLLAAADPS
jgi:hypothetical protein